LSPALTDELALAPPTVTSPLIFEEEGVKVNTEFELQVFDS